MQQGAEYGMIAKAVFSFTFVDAMSGSRRKLKTADLTRDAVTRLRALPRQSMGWLYPLADHRLMYASSAADLPDAAVGPAFFSTVQRVQRWDADAQRSAGVSASLKELLLDPRLPDQDKLSLLVLPWVVRHNELVMGAVDRSIYSTLRKALAIDRQWLDLAQDVPGDVRSISEWLLEPEELVDLKERRGKALEEKRQAEELERRRQEAEREKERLEAEAQARVRAERTEALRRALAAGRGNVDLSAFVVTEEFQRVFELVEGGTGLLFVTGKPGTGKSTLIQALKERLKSRNLAVLAFTGTAALNVGGQTINSFFRMPFGVLPFGWVNDSPRFREKARALEIMIVDEVSMLRPDMLDAMDSALRRARGDHRPFGGAQVVLVGDLFQLPPIIDDEPAVMDLYNRLYAGRNHFTAAVALRQRKPILVELTRVFRQTQAEFLGFLSRIREATITGEELDSFNAQVRARPDFQPNEFHVIVTPLRRVAAGYNRTQLEQLPGALRTYDARFEGDVEPPDPASEVPSSKFPADLRLELKLGAQVMFVKNDGGRRWVNGDLGIVEELSEDWIRVTAWSGVHKVDRVSWPLIRYDLDQDTHRLVATERGKFIQFPVRLAWATTIHKMQGQTVDRIKIDLSAEPFETGMTYVALSRCRTVEGIRLTQSLVMGDLIVDSEVRKELDAMPRWEATQRS